jgi:hypothetical protein
LQLDRGRGSSGHDLNENAIGDQASKVGVFS